MDVRVAETRYIKNIQLTLMHKIYFLLTFMSMMSQGMLKHNLLLEIQWYNTC